MSDEATSQRLIIQEVAKSGKVPDDFLYQESLVEAIDVPNLWSDILLIDYSLLFSPTPAGELELAKLTSALSNWGCIQVINHGISNILLEEVFRVGKQFFALPLEEKIKCSTPDEKVEGYANNVGRSTAETKFWSDSLFLSLQPDIHRQFWPQNPENFSKTVDEYNFELTRFADGFYKAMARCLKLEQDVFLKNQGKERRAGVFNFYPRCPCPERVLGLKPHTDASSMTILLQDMEVSSLQIEKDGLWYKVPAIPSSLLINIGDLGEVMTNGIFKSMTHRVVTSPAEERMSLAIFKMPQVGKDIGPVSELVNDEQPQRYKILDFDKYSHICFEALTKGVTRLDAMKH